MKMNDLVKLRKRDVLTHSIIYHLCPDFHLFICKLHTTTLKDISTYVHITLSCTNVTQSSSSILTQSNLFFSIFLCGIYSTFNEMCTLDHSIIQYSPTFIYKPQLHTVSKPINQNHILSL